jgi:integrase
MATITKRGGTYRIKVSCGYSADGRQITRSMTWQPAPGTTKRLKLGDKWEGSPKIFTTWKGSAICPDTVTSWFHSFIKRHDLPPVTVHGLRHTNATLLIYNGTNIKTVSDRLGHADVSTTGNIYAHAIKTADEMAAEALEDIFNRKKKTAGAG